MTAGAKQPLPASTICGLLLLVLVWALCFPLIEVGLVSAPALRFAALRALFAGALLVALSWLLRRPFPSGARTWLELAGIGLSLTALGFGGMFLAGGRVTPGLATVVANAQPLVAALLGYLVLGEHLRGLRGLALAVGSAGIVVIAAPSLAAASGSRNLSGVVYVLLGSAGVAVGNVLLKHLSGRVDPVSATGCQLLLGSVLLFLASATFEPRAVVEWSTPFIVDLAVLSVLGTALPFALWFALLRSAELNRLNTFTLLTPVFGLIIGALFYRERPSTVQWAGISLVFAGAALASVAGTGSRSGSGPSPRSSTERAAAAPGMPDRIQES